MQPAHAAQQDCQTCPSGLGREGAARGKGGSRDHRRRQAVGVSTNSGIVGARVGRELQIHLWARRGLQLVPPEVAGRACGGRTSSRIQPCSAPGALDPRNHSRWRSRAQRCQWCTSVWRWVNLRLGHGSAEATRKGRSCATSARGTTGSPDVQRRTHAGGGQYVGGPPNQCGLETEATSALGRPGGRQAPGCGARCGAFAGELTPKSTVGRTFTGRGARK